MDNPTTPAGSESRPHELPARPSVPQHGVPVAPKAITPAPKPKRVRTRKQAASRDVAPADVSITEMRRNGLTYHGPADRVFFPPKLGKPIAGESMDGPTAAYHVPDRATLLWLLDQGFRLAAPPAPTQE